MNIVLVHGEFADGSSWSKVIPPSRLKVTNSLGVSVEKYSVVR